MFPTAIRVGLQSSNGMREDCVSLLSSDSVLFYVSRSVLIDASPFFRDLLSLQQPSDSREGLQSAIPFPEDSETLQLLLQLCFDLSEPPAKDIHTICRALDAAQKYQLQDARMAAKNWIRSHINFSPRETFAFACRYELEEEAVSAAETWKDRYTQKYRRADSDFSMSIEGASYIPEMNEICSGSYFRLLQYVRAPSDTLDWRPFSFVRPQFSSAYRNAQKRIEQPPRAVSASPLPTLYEQSTDFVLMSTDGHAFGVHKLVLDLAGGSRLVEGAKEESERGLPMCRIGAIGWVLALVIQLCYPLGAPGVWQDLFAVQEILTVASKYEMAPLLEMGKNQLAQVVQSAPLRIYFVAAENGWLDLAEQAARVLSTQQIEDQYVPEMENVSARAYYRLLRYHHECRTAINRVISRHSDYVQGWKMIPQNRQRTSTSLMIPLPIVEMWTQKLLAAQCPRPSDHRAAPVTQHKKRKDKVVETRHPLLSLDLQTDYVDATHAMETEIREELVQVQPKLDQS